MINPNAGIIVGLNISIDRLVKLGIDSLSEHFESEVYMKYHFTANPDDFCCWYEFTNISTTSNPIKLPV